MGQFDGILGLGFEGLALGGATTVFKNAIDQGKVSQPMFAFKLGDNADGELTFGGYGKFLNISVIRAASHISTLCVFKTPSTSST